jgi:membrane fusion protein, multidrug efflux system
MNVALFSRLDRFARSSRGLRQGTWLLAVVAFLPSVGCRRSDPQSQEMMQRPPAQVTVATAVARDVPVYLEEIGKTVAVEVVSIIPQVGGKIIAAQVKDGDDVKKGQLLFEIDPRPLEAVLAAAKATLAQNRADMELAQIQFKRMEDLAPKGSASQLEFDEERLAYAVAEAKVAAAQAAVQTAELNLQYTKISSPIDGRAGVRLVDAGNVVKENDAPMQVIRRLDPIYVEFTVTENDLGTVRKYVAAHGLEWDASSERGLRVEVDVPGDSARILKALGATKATTAPASPSTGPRTGRLTFLDNSVQGTTGTIRLRATVDNADHYFWPGQFVNVRLVLTTKKDAVLVPVIAQQIGQQGPYVYVVSPESTAELRPIVAGQRQGELLVIESGVQDGEKVVIAGQMAVMPNAKVHVTNPAPDGVPPGGAPQASARAPQ